jgi:hypothetical protein
MLEPTQATAHTVVDQGPLTQVYLTGAQLGLTAPGTVGPFASGGYSKLAVGATNSAAGSIVVQRYLDQAGTIPQGAALTQALTGGTAGVLNITDGVPFQSFTIQITGAGTLSNVACLLQSQ